MDILTNTYKADPNAKVHSLYQGVAPGNRTVTTLVKPSRDGQRLEATKQYGPMMERSAGGRAAILVLGGMETTLAEMQYILEAKKAKVFVPKRAPGDIVAMCRLVQERRNELIESRRKFLKANPSDAPKKRRIRMYLPVGYRFVPTTVPGFQVLARV